MDPASGLVEGLGGKFHDVEGTQAVRPGRPNTMGQRMVTDFRSSGVGSGDRGLSASAVLKRL